MTFRENTLAVLNYEPYEKMPVVSFGYWAETVEKWANEGYITRDEALGYQRQGDNSEADRAIMLKLGFDFNWNSCVSAAYTLFPTFETEVLEQLRPYHEIVPAILDYRMLSKLKSTYAEGLLTPVLESYAMGARARLDKTAEESGLRITDYVELPKRLLPRLPRLSNRI